MYSGCVQATLVLFFFTISRTVLTQLRKTPLKAVIPVDENIAMHKFLAYCCKFSCRFYEVDTDMYMHVHSHAQISCLLLLSQAKAELARA